MNKNKLGVINHELSNKLQHLQKKIQKLEKRPFDWKYHVVCIKRIVENHEYDNIQSKVNVF